MSESIRGVNPETDQLAIDGLECRVWLPTPCAWVAIRTLLGPERFGRWVAGYIERVLIALNGSDAAADCDTERRGPSPGLGPEIRKLEPAVGLELERPAAAQPPGPTIQPQARKGRSRHP